MSEPAARGFYATQFMSLFDNEKSDDDKEVEAGKVPTPGQNTSPKPRSKEQVQWMLLDSKGK